MKIFCKKTDSKSVYNGQTISLSRKNKFAAHLKDLTTSGNLSTLGDQT